MEWVNGKIHWNPLFIGEASDWEMESLEYFLDDLYAVKIDQAGTDRLVWPPVPKHGFLVKIYYRMLRLGGASVCKSYPLSLEEHLES